MKRIIGIVLALAMVLTLLPVIAFADSSPADFGWGSDTANWNYWTTTADGDITLTNVDASNAAGENCRIWKDILVDTTFTWSFDLKVDPNARAYINLLGTTLEAGVNGDGGYWIPQTGNWLMPTDGFVNFEIVRDGGDATVKVTPTGGAAYSWTFTPVSEIATVEFGMWNSANNGFTIKDMSYVNAIAHYPNEFGWLSDTANWNYWTATEDGDITLTDVNASNAAGENCRIWKDILVDTTFTWSFGLKVDPNARVYINLLGTTLEAGVNGDGGYWIPQTGNWLTPTDGFMNFVLARDGGDVTVTVTPTGGAAYSWTFTPASEIATVEFGMWNSANNGFSLRNMTYANELPAPVYTPADFGWGSDTANWNYWTTTADGDITLTDVNASNAAGENCRIWKSILVDTSFIWSFDLKVDANARVYINLLGTTLEAGTNGDGGYWIPQTGNWLTPTDGFVNFVLTRDGGDVTVTVTPTGGAAYSWTFTPVSDNPTVEFGMWNSDNNGFTIKNMSYTVPEESGAEIKSAFLRIDENINVIYAAEVPAGYTDPYMVFTFQGRDITVTDYTEADGKLLFELSKVVPQCMGDNISATLYATKDGETVTDTVAEYSIKTYCENQLAKTDDAALITLLSDLLAYGAAAQTYTGYKTDALVTSGLDLTPSTFTALEKQKAALTGEKSEAADWTSATIGLSNELMVRFYFTAASTDGLSVDVTVGDRTESFDADDFGVSAGGRYFVTLNGIKATEFNEAVTATFKQGGEAVGRTVSYSVNTYISATQDCGNANLEALVKALYNYGASAAAYNAK